MNRPMVTLIACAAMLAPLAVPSQANDAHHPEKNAKAKKSTGVKTKQPPAKTNKSSMSGAASSVRTDNAS